MSTIPFRKTSSALTKADAKSRSWPTTSVCKKAKAKTMLGFIFPVESLLRCSCLAGLRSQVFPNRDRNMETISPFCVPTELMFQHKLFL